MEQGPLSEQQQRILRAFGTTHLAMSSALSQAFIGESRPLTRSEAASLSRALRRLELRGLLVRKGRGSCELTSAGVERARSAGHPIKPAQQATPEAIAEAARQARLAAIRARLDALEQNIRALR